MPEAHRSWPPHLAAALMLCATCAAQRAGAEEPGSWRFLDDTRPVKVIVLGGSVSAYPAGGYPQWLTEVCPRIDVQNRAKAKLGALQLRQRFIAQVLKNRRLQLAEIAETWLVFLGGLNSVGSPETTNLEVAKTFKLAKDAGIHTIGVSINPWGSEADRRWRGLDGIAYFEYSQRTVDFLMGRLTPLEAFGEALAKTHPGERFLPGELPDLAVDLWSGPLRDLDAPFRDSTRLGKQARGSAWVKRRLAGLPEADRAGLLAKLIAQAAALPRWFMKPAFVGFDPIHPNALGHREIAHSICTQAPPSWGCNCTRLEQLAWDRRANKPKTL